ncbi:MAG: excinuclease ABC subunit UvrC [Rhodospirillaceae bacterium]
MPPTEQVTPQEGVEVVRKALATMPNLPGVYRMLDAKGDALYVGKARNLKKRVTSYAQLPRLQPRLQRMVSLTRSMEVVTTHTEAEALLLESNLIKKLKPRYNILLRDDKSFPYIEVTKDHAFPRILKHRGARRKDREYFGPFASALSVKRTLTALQKAFLLRTCSDSIFSARTRPCLLYQIKRCSAPCVDRIDDAEYGELVGQAREFLSGRSTAMQEDLAKRMEEAAEALEFERAALLRDRIMALTNVQSRQDINLPTLPEADVLALHRAGGHAAVQVFFFRGGRNNGTRTYFPSNSGEAADGEVLEAFLGQFYANHLPPREILLNADLPHQELMIEALSLRAERKVTLSKPERGAKRKLMDHALSNAKEALGRRMAESSAQMTLLEGTAKVFGLEAPPERIEVYDNSHISGAHAVGAMIVAGLEGFRKSAYRTFTIKDKSLSPGDDYGMMREVMGRRFSRAMKEDPDRDRGQWPDLVLIDGGKGQIGAVMEVFAELGIEDEVAVFGVAKGPDRNAGRERFFPPEGEPFSLPPNDPVLYFIQRLRDEAHRFAIGTHRKKRSKAISGSPLDDVPGVGGARKKALLHHFGSAKAVSQAGLSDLEAVEGISAALAQKIYDHFHGN